VFGVAVRVPTLVHQAFVAQSTQVAQAHQQDTDAKQYQQCRDIAETVTLVWCGDREAGRETCQQGQASRLLVVGHSDYASRLAVGYPLSEAICLPAQKIIDFTKR
jgi:hypothetical protein